VRRLVGQKRVGHAGTLDPLAEGVLPILVGRATRLADLIHSGPKTYVSMIQLGVATETDDAEGAITSSASVPLLSPSLVESALQGFRGEIIQTPPKFSALKVAGQRAYALARAGAAVDLAPRPVHIDELRLLDCSETTLTLEVTCSKGTYIRALARDIAASLGTVGHMASLLRTRVGPFLLANAHSIEEVAAHDIRDSLLPSSSVLPEAPPLELDSESAWRFSNGQAIPFRDLHAEVVWVYDPVGRLIGLGSAHGGVLRPRLAL
jgi:tRNA pseudouridine55 synthase